MQVTKEITKLVQAGPFGVIEETSRQVVTLDNGQKITGKLEKRILQPGADVSEESDTIKAMAAAWTPEIIADYNDVNRG